MSPNGPSTACHGAHYCTGATPVVRQRGARAGLHGLEQGHPNVECSAAFPHHWSLVLRHGALWAPLACSRS